MDPQQLPLRDIHLPEAIGWWPIAPGWWLLLFVLLTGCVLLLRSYVRRRARGAARREALKQLDQLLAEYDGHRDAVSFMAGVSSLLRRTMLAYAPRKDIAGLTGDEWLAWLDQDLDAPRFQTETGRKLLEMPYRKPDQAVATMELIDVVSAVRQRLATPVGGRA